MARISLLRARSRPYPQAPAHPSVHSSTLFLSFRVHICVSVKMAAALCNHALTAGLAGRCARPAKSRRSLRVSAAQSGDAQVWLPGVERPNHLEGKGLPGNRGFDPLGLGRDEDRLKWYDHCASTACSVTVCSAAYACACITITVLMR